MKVKILAVWVASLLFAGGAESADRVRIGVSNYNLSNLTVGVAQTKDFFKQEGIDAEIIRMNPNVATMALVSGDMTIQPSSAPSSEPTSRAPSSK